MKGFLFVICCLLQISAWAQYEFSGSVSPESRDGKIYLSVVEDYRKISGVYPEQILAETKADSSGYFSFNGDNLPLVNKIYRIHIDNCSEEDQRVYHFTGYCPNSREIIFVANNETQLSLPFSFDNEMFCRVVSSHEKSHTFLKIDSLKNDMRFAFGTYRSEANRRLNTKKWFNILQQYGEQLQEPLAELYSYAFLSDRTSDLYAYYLEDLRNNTYYDELLSRLKEKYPDSPYTEQFESELNSDKYLIESQEAQLPWWAYLLAGITITSLGVNFYLTRKLASERRIRNGKATLTQQENKVLDLILQDKSNKEIASQMFVSVSTVKTHINNLYKKLQVGSRDEVKSLYSN